MSEHHDEGVGDERGASPSMLQELDGGRYSRQRFLTIVGSIGVAGAASAVLAACGDEGSAGTDRTSGSATSESETGASSGTTSSMAGDTPSDLEIVNYALTLEYLEADFYDQVAQSGLFQGAELDLIKTFGSHEQAHVTALEQTARSLGQPAPKPKTQFPLEDKAAVLQLAADVENLGAAAYLEQAANISDQAILEAALAIHTVEARHAAALNRLTGSSPTPDGAFGAPMTMEEVLEVAGQFIVS